MKIAVPTENGVLCPHFGHCNLFAILDIDPETKTIKAVNNMTPPPHDVGVLPAWLHQLGCTHIIAGGMGGRAIALFQQNGIQVICGARIEKPEVLVEYFLNNKLETGSNYCDEPGFKPDGHDNCGNH
jgi:predicted Fe-Mo cluster-binding NifX family protein